ncbi:MAG TPA: hypothetical protein VL022_05035 [Moheibacter sp.]|nr:hypothetical protein [Moheibacter sp.]
MISSKTITAMTSCLLGGIGLLLLLMGSFIFGFAQIYVAYNVNFKGECLIICSFKLLSLKDFKSIIYDSFKRIKMTKTVSEGIFSGQRCSYICSGSKWGF